MLSLNTYDRCCHCKKFKMVFIIEMDEKKDRYCYKCGTKFKEIIEQIEEKALEDPAYMAELASKQDEE